MSIKTYINIPANPPNLLVIVGPCRTGTTALANTFAKAGIDVYMQPIKSARRAAEDTEKVIPWDISGEKGNFVVSKETLGPKLPSEFFNPMHGLFYYKKEGYNKENNKMTNINYKKVYEKAARNVGWSKTTPDRTTKWGDFYEVVKKNLHGFEIVLDIGTAEGNRFIGLSKYIKKGIGIDLEPGMIKLAKQNKRKAKAVNVIFKYMAAEHLDFSDRTFDIVTIKHSPINFKEAFRVLKSDGLLYTQQVSENDKSNLKNAFGRGQDYNKKNGSLLEQYKKEAKLAGFQNIKSITSSIPHYFKTKQKLLDFLQKAPTIPEFGKYSKDYEILEKFITKNRTPKGIKSNTARFFLEMTKK